MTGVSLSTVEEVLARLRAADFWTSPENKTAIRAKVPPFRLSKFQRALPPAAETEFVANSFLDFEGAARVLGQPSARGGTCGPRSTLVIPS